MNRLLEQLRRSALPAPVNQPTDGQLLECFIARRDEVAFAALVRRHGPMVLGVCRRVIGNPDDADDAFQATFLVLVRKASSVRPRQAVGNWLYGVAFRTALRVRGRVARQRARETSLPELAPAASEAEKFSPEEHSLLHAELSRLSEKYRLPVVLCELEGRSRREVAGQLNIPEGTLSSRLAAARKMLAQRLARRGVALSVGVGAALLASCKASAAVPEVLVLSTTRAALFVAAGPVAAAGLVSANVATLTEGVLKAMFLAKLKFTAAVAIGVVALGVGTGGALYQAQVFGQEQGGSRPGARPADERTDKARVARELDQIQKEVQALRDQLERSQAEGLDARKMAEDLRRKLEEERARAEHAQRLAEEARQQAVAQLKRAREMAEMQAKQAEDATLAARQAMERRNASQPRRGQPPQADPGPTQGQPAGDAELLKLQQKRQELRQMVERKRADLELQMQELATQEQALEEAIRQHQAQLIRQGSGKPPQPQQATGEDKLDRILQRLDQLDRRLQRLEREKREE